MTRITETEYREEMKQLDALRMEKYRPAKLTEEQYTLLKYARDGDKPVPWRMLSDWFGKKYKPISENTLKSRFRAMSVEKGDSVI